MSPTAGPRRPAAILAGLLLSYVALVIYASLAPFEPWLPWSDFEADFLIAPIPRYLSGIDLLLNLLAYLPLGWLAAALCARRHPGWNAVARATLVGALLSVAMELRQVLLPPRVASNVDLLSNTLGALLGALPWAWPRMLANALAPLERVRVRLLGPGSGPEFGACLLLLWWVCQLNPSIPFLGAGVLEDPDRLAWYEGSPDSAQWMLQACAAAFSACGLGLFLACLLARSVQPLAAGLVTLVTLLGIKAAAAHFLLKPALAVAWFDSATLAGLAAGSIALLLALRFGVRLRALAAAVCLRAGGLFAKLDGHYASWFALRSMFELNFAQLRNFEGLTVWINELWPVLAVVFLMSWRPVPAADRVSSRP